MNFGKILGYYNKINNEKMNNNINEENEISSEYEKSNSIVFLLKKVQVI